MTTPTLNEARHALASAIRNQGGDWKGANAAVKALEASWGRIPEAEKVQRLIAAADNYGEL